MDIFSCYKCFCFPYPLNEEASLSGKVTFKGLEDKEYAIFFSFSSQHPAGDQENFGNWIKDQLDGSYAKAGCSVLFMFLLSVNSVN